MRFFKMMWQCRPHLKDIFELHRWRCSKGGVTSVINSTLIGELRANSKSS